MARKLPQVQDPAAVMGWLSRIAENEIRDRADYLTRQRRDAAQRRPIEEAENVPAPVRLALSQVIANESMERVERAMDELPDAQREVVILRMLEELSFPEIAQALEISQNTAASRYRYALTKLREALAEEPSYE